MKISKTTEDDLEDMLKLMKNYYNFMELSSPREEKLKQKIMNYIHDMSVGVQFIARIDGKPAGYATLDVSYSAVRMGNILVLSELHIDVDYLGQDIGKQLFKFCQDYTIQNKYTDMLWLTNTEKYALQVLYDKFDKENEFYNQ